MSSPAISVSEYVVVLQRAPSQRLMGSRTANAAKINAAPSNEGGTESQPFSTGHVVGLQSPALVLNMVDRRLDFVTAVAVGAHRGDAQGEEQTVEEAGPVPYSM